MMKARLMPLLVVLVLSLAAMGLASCSGSAPQQPTAAPAPASSAGSVALNPHPASLEGKTVVLRWNGKPNGDKFLNRVAELLTQQVQGVKIVKLWEADPSTAVSSDSDDVSAQIVGKIAAQKPDLVIAAQCD